VNRTQKHRRGFDTACAKYKQMHPAHSPGFPEDSLLSSSTQMTSVVDLYSARLTAAKTTRALRAFEKDLRREVAALSRLRRKALVVLGYPEKTRVDLETALRQVADSTRDVQHDHLRAAFHDRSFTALVLPPRELWPADIVVPNGLLVLPVKVDVMWRANPEDWSPSSTDFASVRLQNTQDIDNRLVAAGRCPPYLWTRHAEESVKATGPVAQWTQDTLLAHIDLWNPDTETYQLRLGNEPEDTGSDAGSDTEGDTGEEDEDEEPWRRECVTMTLVCASDERLLSTVWPSELRKTWVMCVVAAAQGCAMLHSVLDRRPCRRRHV
jgi:hypothetical protein